MPRTDRIHSAALTFGRSRLHTALACVALLAACSGKPASEPSRRDAAVQSDDASTDASTDASPDAATDAITDAATDATRDAAHEPDTSLPPEPALEWQRATLALEPDGRTHSHTLELAPGSRAFAVRSSLASNTSTASVCFQLEEVSHGAEVWVGPAGTDDYGDYCRTCRERVAAGAGYGFHVLPSGGDDSRELDSITLRVALRDCLTLTPLSAAEAKSGELTLEHTAWTPPPRAASLRLPVSFVLATEHADDSLIPGALETLRETWSAAGIVIELAATASIDTPPDPLNYGADDRNTLIALSRVARSALDARGIARVWPVFVFSRCLRRSDVLSGGRSEPLATTPHIPGGFGLGDEPDLIIVAAERCEGLSPGPRFLDPITLGAVLAHELGHYLGLFHVTESNGQPDSLSDTEPDTPNLMLAMPDPNALTLTDSQMRVARRHPSFAQPSRIRQP